MVKWFLIITLFFGTAWSSFEDSELSEFKEKKTLSNPAEIDYEGVIGFDPKEGDVLEWSETLSSKDKGMVQRSLFPPSGLSLRWFGSTGIELRDDQDTLLIDPFLSRPGYVEVLLFSNLEIDTEAVDKYITKFIDMSRVRAILTSHAHHDHVQDVPYILSQYPKVSQRPVTVGSMNIFNLLRAYTEPKNEISWLKGIHPLMYSPLKVVEYQKEDVNTKEGEIKSFNVGKFGKFEVTVFVSAHSHYDLYEVKLKGEIDKKAPLKGGEYKSMHNASLAYLVDYDNGRFKMFFGDSAPFPKAKSIIEKVGPVDVYVQGVASRLRKSSIDEMIAGLQPKYFLPTHYDNFFKNFRGYKKFDTKILMPTDFSRFKGFIKNFYKKKKKGEFKRTDVRLVKLLQYYKIDGLID